MKALDIGFEKFEEDFYANPDTMFIKSNELTRDKVYLKPITDKNDVDYLFKALNESGLSEEVKEKIHTLNQVGKGFNPKCEYIDKEKVLKAVKACSEFCCGECPYQHLDDPDGYLKMRCIHALMVDINKMLNGEEV